MGAKVVQSSKIFDKQVDEVGIELSDNFHSGSKPKNTVEQEVQIKDLTPTQDEMDIAGVQSSGSSNIDVISKDGNLYLVDGHHRVAKAKAEGKTSLTANVSPSSAGKDTGITLGELFNTKKVNAIGTGLAAGAVVGATQAEAGIPLYSEDEFDMANNPVKNEDGGWNAFGKKVVEVPTSGLSGRIEDGTFDSFVSEFTLGLSQLGGEDLSEAIDMNSLKAVFQTAQVPVSYEDMAKKDDIGVLGYVATNRRGDKKLSLAEELKKNPKVLGTTYMHETGHLMQMFNPNDPSHEEITRDKNVNPYELRSFEALANLIGGRSDYPKELTSSRSKYGIHPYIAFDEQQRKFTTDLAKDFLAGMNISKVDKELDGKRPDLRWLQLLDKKMGVALEPLKIEAERLTELLSTDKRFQSLLKDYSIEQPPSGYTSRTAADKREEEGNVGSTARAYDVVDRQRSKKWQRLREKQKVTSTKQPGAGMSAANQIERSK